MPLTRNRFAIGGHFPSDPVRIWNQERTATGEAKIAIVIVSRGELVGQIEEERRFALAGNVGRDLEEVHPPPGQNRGAQKLRLAAIASGLALQLDNIGAADLRGSSR